MRVGQTGPGLIDVEDSSPRSADDDNYEDEQQMSWLPTLRTLPCSECSQGGVAHSSQLTHSVAAQSSSLQDGGHQVSTLPSPHLTSPHTVLLTNSFQCYIFIKLLDHSIQP